MITNFLIPVTVNTLPQISELEGKQGMFVLPDGSININRKDGTWMVINKQSDHAGTLVPSANPSTTAGVAKWYWAKAGTYTNLGGFTLSKSGIISYNGTAWSSLELDFPEPMKYIQQFADLSFPVTNPSIGEKVQCVDNFVPYQLLDGKTSTNLDTPSNSPTIWKSLSIKSDSQLILDSSNPIENKVVAKIVSDVFVNPNAFYNHIISQTFQDSGTNGDYVGYGFGAGIINASVDNVFPADTYTLYIKYRVFSKGNLDGLTYFDGTGEIKTTLATNIVEGQYYEDVVSFTKTSSANSGIWAQIRTRYQNNAVMNAIFEIVAIKVFKGNFTVSEISDYTKVKLAEKAELAEKLGEKYANTITATANKITSQYPDEIASYNSNYSGAGNVVDFYFTVENGILKAGGKALNFSGDTGNNRIWFGFDIKPDFYATESKSVYIVLKGRAKTQNVRNLTFHKNSWDATIYTVLQDMSQNVWTDFQTVIELNYEQGTNDNSRYVYTDYVVYAQNADVVIDWEFSVFGIVEKTPQTSVLSEDDLVAIMLGDYEVIKKNKLPNDIVYQNQLEAFKSGFKIPLGAENLKSDYDVTLIAGYGQSLNGGGGASSSSTYFRNVLSFAGGISLFDVPFSTTSEKNAFYGNGFQKLNGKDVSYPPSTASVLSMIQLIESENTVDLENFGLEFLPLTGGVSGAPISAMKKGTIAYSNFLEVISKAKEFANAEGKTFGVSILNWLQGEGNSVYEHLTYYDDLKQLFIDFNTDIKAITGQTKDVIFITYQTAMWGGIWFPSGETSQQPNDEYFNMPTDVQHAQQRLVDEEANVFMCGAMYQFVYSDFFHPSDRANVGLQMGVAAKRILTDGKDFPTFKPVSHSLVGNFIHLKFSAPKLPIRFDISGDVFHNPRGKQPNFGFKVLNSSGTNIISAEPYIVRGNTVVIPCSESPIGSTIKYAENGHYGGGNLCDSQGIVVNNKNKNYVIDNFAISFDNYTV